MTNKRAEDRKFHFTYKVTCSYNGRVFYGLHSTDELNADFAGKGFSLNESKKDYGPEMHKLERLQVYTSRHEAKIAYNALKAAELINPHRPENRKYHLVYKTTRFDGKYYIGVHSTDDLADGYRGSGTYIGRSLKKHGRDKHTFEILHLCESRDAAFALEAVLITEDTLKDVMCMNSAPGGRQHGNRVYGHTAETGRKISEKLMTHYSSPAGEISKQKVRDGNLGKIRTPEMREKYRLAKQGIQFSDDHRAKLSNAKIGKPFTEKQWANYSNGQSGRCTIDGITIYPSKSALARDLGHGKTGARSPNFKYIDQDRYTQSDEQRKKARDRMLGKSHNWKKKTLG